MKRNYSLLLLCLYFLSTAGWLSKTHGQVVSYAIPNSSHFYDFEGNGEKGFVYFFQPESGGKKLYSFGSISGNFERLDILYDAGIDWSPYTASDIIIEDVNRDGIPDINLRSENTLYDKDLLLISKPDKTYTLTGGALSYNFDINNDGKIDLFETVSNKHNYLLTQQANGNFTRKYMRTLTFDEYNTAFDPAVWLEVQRAAGLGRLPSRGGVVFSGVSLDNSDFSIPDKQRPDVCIDLNKDGIPDLLSLETGMVFYGTSDPETYIISGLGNQVTVKDLNGDGITDYIVSDIKNKTVYTMVYEGNGEFRKQTLTSSVPTDKNIYCFDFDRDGNVDILITSGYPNNSMGTFIFTCRNDGSGNFTVEEKSSFDKWVIAGCQDIDNDGYFDLLMIDVADMDYYGTGNQLKILCSKGKENFGFTDAQLLYTANEHFVSPGFTKNISLQDLGDKKWVNVEDIDHDGYMEIWLKDDNYVYKANGASTNTPPSKPAAPSIIYDAGTSKLTLAWTQGADNQSSACDLTYSLRIGTENGKGDIVFAHANADGVRRNFQDGNMGHDLSKTYDVHTWLPGIYYISLQAIDPQHCGSPWSDEVSFEHTFPASNFTLNTTSLSTADTLKVFFTEAPGFTYEWELDGAQKLASSTVGELHLQWAAGGKKSIALQIVTPGGSNTQKSEEMISVLDNRIMPSETLFPYNGYTTNQGKSIYHGHFADWNMDGVQDVLTSYLQYGDGLYKNDGTNNFTKLMKSFNISFNPQSAKWVDWDMDGVVDLFYKNNDDSYGYLKNTLNDNFTPTALSLDFINTSKRPDELQMADLNNDGRYEIISGRSVFSAVYLNRGNNRFEYKEDLNYYSHMVDWNRDGYLDFYKIREPGNAVYAYLGVEVMLNKGNFEFEERYMPFEQSISFDNLKAASVVDFNNDGYHDIVFFKNERTIHVLLNENNERFVNGYDIVIEDENAIVKSYDYTKNPPRFVFDPNIRIFDIDNNGYPDILISALNRAENPSHDSFNLITDLYVIYNDGGNSYRQGFISQCNGFTSTSSLLRNVTLTDTDGDGVPEIYLSDKYVTDEWGNATHYKTVNKNRTNITNTKPQAPAGLIATQQADVLLIEWDHAVDAETLWMHMRYSLSVKKKGASDAGSYIISPMNGGNSQMAALPFEKASYYYALPFNGDDYPGKYHYYIHANRYEIPLSVVPLGDIEISVQAIDLWDAMSPFSETLTVTIENSPRFSMPSTVCFGVPVEINYNGTQGGANPVWDFDGGAVISGEGFGPYMVQWNSEGVKNITLSVAGEVFASQIKVLPDYSAQFDIAENVFYETEMEISLPDVPSYATFTWELSNNSGIFLEHRIDAVPGNSKGKIYIYGGGEKYRELKLRVEMNGCEKTFTKGFNVVPKLNPPAITLIYPDVNSKNIITWRQNQLPENTSEIIIYKEGNYLNDFREIGRVQPSANEFTDENSNSTVKSERYAIAAVLQSGIISPMSEVHQTLHLTINKGISEGQWNLIWTPYRGRTIGSYRILRGASPTQMNEIASVSGAVLSYSDNNPDAGEPYYALEYTAIESRAGALLTNDNNTSRSNTVFTGDARTITYMNKLNILSVDDNSVLSEEQPVIYLYTEILPSNTTYTSAYWEITEGIELATIDENGVLQAACSSAGGTVTVRASSTDGSGVANTRQFTISAFTQTIPPPVNLNAVVVNSEVTLSWGGSTTDYKVFYYNQNTSASGERIVYGSQFITLTLPDGEYQWSVCSWSDAENKETSERSTGDNFIVSPISSIDDEAVKDILLTPNPVKDRLYIETTAAIQRVQIIDISGVMLMEKNGDVAYLDMAALPQGIYIVIIQTGKGRYPKRFVKK